MSCWGIFREDDLLAHMRKKPWLDSHAPAFRKLDKPKPKSKSAAALMIFGP
jgi:hypothetical protein